LAVRAALFAFLKNSRKTVCGGKRFLVRLVLRAAPLCAFEELADNGVRRGAVRGPLSGACRTLCAFEELAQNGVRREAVPGPLSGACRTPLRF
jgi:hypothetical protein